MSTDYFDQFNASLLNISIKGVVHFKKKKLADNLLTPMSFNISMSFFQDFSPYNALYW